MKVYQSTYYNHQSNLFMQHAMLPGVELFNNFKEYQAHEHYTHKYHGMMSKHHYVYLT